MKNRWISILIIGMTLGTAWAVRGQFGHEQGAACAGSIGAMGLVLVSQRRDWYQKIFSVALASAVGWGAGGMISYGMVVGYGRSDNFPNTFYGLSMLFVIGGLFGLIGGGLTGLALESSDENKVKWGNLIAEMTAGGLIVYYLLVEQLGLLMTPPRSEAWAVCLGAGLAMIWYMARNNFQSSVNVAIYTALGAGFGFAFGNFLQTVGNVLEINFNMWNVMEYSIGFFGGVALACSIFTSKWPEVSEQPEKWESRSAFILLCIFLPLIIFRENFQYSQLLERIGDKPFAENGARLGSLFAIVVLIVLPVVCWLKVEKTKFSFTRSNAWHIFVVYFLLYIVISYVVTGAFAGILLLNHHLYVLNLIIILYLSGIQPNPFSINPVSVTRFKAWSIYFGAILIMIVTISFLSIIIHREMSGAQNRFPVILTMCH